MYMCKTLRIKFIILTRVYGIKQLHLTTIAMLVMVVDQGDVSSTAEVSESVCILETNNLSANCNRLHRFGDHNQAILHMK